MILALSNSKGGVGKTTIAVHLAVWLFEQGHKIAFVDSDVQGSSSAWLQEAAPEIKPIRLLTAEDVLAQLPTIQTGVDYVVIDGPAGLSQVTRAIMCMADVAILPCGPSILDLRAAIDAVGVLRQIQEVQNGLPLAVVIPNKLQPQYRLSKDLLQTVQKIGLPAGDGLRLRQAYADAAGQGTVVWRMFGQSAHGATAELQYLFQQLISYESNNRQTKHDRRTATTHPIT
jgi:chromosome partitioning protein